MARSVVLPKRFANATNFVEITFNRVCQKPLGWPLGRLPLALAIAEAFEHLFHPNELRMPIHCALNSFPTTGRLADRQGAPALMTSSLNIVKTAKARRVPKAAERGPEAAKTIESEEFT